MGYALKGKKYDMAVAMTLLLDQPSDLHGNLKLVADIISYIQEDQPNLPIPPFLIIRKAQFLNKKGEFHRAIRDLASILDNGKEKGYRIVIHIIRKSQNKSDVKSLAVPPLQTLKTE